MANYTKTTDFAAKDTLPGGDTNKVIRGTEFETEFDAISTAIATKADTASPTFTGTATFATLNATTIDLNGGALDNVVIGATTAAAGTFTDLTASGTISLSGLSVGFSEIDAGAVTLSTETFSDVDNQIPTNAAVIDYVAGAIPGIAEVNDLSAVVTWADVPDANITQSSVTQHQAALSITASQLSDVTATATELNFVDGVTSNIQTQIDSINPSPSITVTADGAIANGDPCIITSAGKAKKIAGSTYLKGTDKTYTTSDPGADGLANAYDPDQNQFVVFNKVSSNNRIYGVSVNSSANTVGFGSAITPETSAIWTSQALVYDTTEDRFLCAYRAAGASNYGKAFVVAHSSGLTYTNGTKTTFESSAIDDVRCVYDSNSQRVVIFYKSSTSTGSLKSIVAEIDNTDNSVSFGTAVTADSDVTINELYGVTFDSNANKVVAIYEKTNRLYSIVGTVDNSDNSITFATPVELPAINSEGNYNPYYAAIGFDASANRLVAATVETTNANEFQGTFLTSGSISGTTVTWRDWTSWLTGPDSSGGYYSFQETGFLYNSTRNSNVFYGERTTGSQIIMQEFKLDSSGDPSFTLAPKIIVEGSNQDSQRMAFNPTEELYLLSRANGSATTHCVVRDRSGSLLEGEFAGISDAAYSDGNTATLQITGSVDDAQTGLETGRLHVVQGDGTIVPKHEAGDFVTAAGNKEPNQNIGVAKSATEILIG